MFLHSRSPERHSKSRRRRGSARKQQRLGVELLEQRELLATGLGVLPGLTDSASGRLVTGLYYDLLQRVPQPNEAAGWIAAVNAGQSAEQVALHFTASTEYQTYLIQDDYDNFLNRAPLPQELTGWLQQLATGLNEEQLAAKFLASNEFYLDHGSTPTDWLQGVYESVLGRAPDAAGLATWSQALQNGVGREQVALSIVTSPEAYGLTVDAAYNSLLYRPAEAAGRAYWVAAMEQGMTPSQLRARIASSAEYVTDQANIAGTSARTLLSASPSPSYHFDFGTPESAVAPGYVGVPLYAYSSMWGYGWENVEGMGYRNRNYPDPLTRDFNWGQDGTFRVDLPNGTYAVTVTLGDARFLRDDEAIWANGTQMVSGLTTQAGQFLRPTFLVQVVNNELELRIANQGGVNPNFAIDGLDINPDTALVVNAGPAQTASAGTPVTFAGSTAGGTAPLSYSWKFGDGTTAWGSLTPTHTYANVGTYTVTLKATDAYGLISQSTTVVTVNPVSTGSPPVANAGPAQTANEGTAVTFAGSASGGTAPLSYSWTFGDGTTASGSLTPTHTYTSDGSYTATLKVTDAAGLTAQSSTTVTVNNLGPSNVQLTLSATSINEGNTVNLSGSFTDPDTTDTHQLVINWGDGSANTTVNLTAGQLTFSGVSHQYLNNPSGGLVGSYSINVTVSDNDGGQATGSTSIQVSDVAPTVNSGGPYTATLGSAINFTPTVTDVSPEDTATGFGYSWNFGDGTTSTTPSPIHTYAAAGTYTVTLSVSDDDGATTVVTTTATVNTTTGTTYYVATTGSNSNPGTITQPFRTLNYAVSFLQPGDTLYVRGGTYTESLIDVIPGGTSWSAPVTVAAYPGESVTIRPGASSEFAMHFAASAEKYIIISGFLIDAQNVTNDAIKITFDSTAGASTHIRVQNCEIENSPGQGILITGATGNSSDYNEIINDKVHNDGAANLDHGIYIESNHNVVEGCDIYNNGDQGIQIYMTGGVPGVNSSYNTVFDNKIHDNGVMNSTACALSFNNGDGNLAYNNLIWNSGSGIRVDYGATNTLIYNNTIYNTTDPSGAGVLCGDNVGASNTTVRNNIIYQNAGGDIVNRNGATTTADHNLLSNTNPMFVNAAAYDFHLLAGSPAIDAGVVLTQVTVDFAGVTRDGPAYEIGAYEFE